MILLQDIITFFNNPNLRQYTNNINNTIFWCIYNFYDNKNPAGNRIKSIDERSGFDICYYDDIGFHRINKIKSGRLYNDIKSELITYLITKKMSA